MPPFRLRILILHTLFLCIAKTNCNKHFEPAQQWFLVHSHQLHFFTKSCPSCFWYFWVVLDLWSRQRTKVLRVKIIIKKTLFESLLISIFFSTFGTRLHLSTLESYHTLLKVFCCFATQTNTFSLNAHKKTPYFIFHNHVDYDIDRPSL